MLLFASVHNYPEALKRLLVKIRIIRKSERLEAIEMFHSVFFNLILFCFTFFFFSVERRLLAGCRGFLYETSSVPTASNPRNMESKWKK